jgi:hypothetical protein
MTCGFVGVACGNDEAGIPRGRPGQLGRRCSPTVTPPTDGVSDSQGRLRGGKAELTVHRAVDNERVGGLKAATLTA